KVVVKIEQAECRVTVQTDRGGADFKLDPAVAVDINVVAGDQRAVDARCTPFVDTGWLEADAALQVTDSRHAARRVGERRRGERSECYQGRGPPDPGTVARGHGHAALLKIQWIGPNGHSGPARDKRRSGSTHITARRLNDNLEIPSR